MIERIEPTEIDFPRTDPTPKPQAVPEEYRDPEDPTAAYRAYYAGEKAEWAEWAHTDEPPWLDAHRTDIAAESGEAAARDQS